MKARYYTRNEVFLIHSLGFAFVYNGRTWNKRDMDQVVFNFNDAPEKLITLATYTCEEFEPLEKNPFVKLLL